MSLQKIAGGTVYDPVNGVNGVVMDLWIRDGEIVAPPGAYAPGSPDRVFDAAGLVVMPGGVDMHTHIAGPKVNLARKLRPEDRRKAPPVRRTLLTRSGTVGSTPSTFATGYLYAGLGYTTAFDAAIPPLGARHAHEEFHDTPLIDKDFFLLFGNNHYVLRQVADKRTMFELPRWVIKNGVLVVEQGEIRAKLFGRTLHVAPQYDEGVLPDIRKWSEAYYTVQFANPDISW